MRRSAFHSVRFPGCKKLVACAALLLLALPGADVQAALIPADQQAFADGLYRRGLHEMALKEYQLLLQEYPEYEKTDAVLFRMAESYRHMGNIPAARRFYARLSMTMKDSAFRERADFRRAELDVRDEKYAEAVKQFDRFLEDASDSTLSSAARYYRGMALRKLGKNAEAEKALRTLVRDEPESAYHAYALLELATLLSGKEDGGAEALSLFAEAHGAADAGRLKAESLFQQAALAYRLKKYDASSEAFRNLLETYPEDHRAEEALYQAAWAAWEAGQYERVLAWCAEAPEGSAGERAAWLHMEARSHRALGQADEAAALYDRLLNDFGDYRERTGALRERAYLAYEQEAFARAAACVLALEDQADPEDRWLLAEAYRATDQGDLALPVFEALGQEAGYSNAVKAAYTAADLAWRQGDGEKAAGAFEGLAEKNPADERAADALYAAGVIRRELKQSDRARKNWAAFLEKAPEHTRVADALYQLAVVEHEAGLKDEADVHYKAYIERWPNGPFAASVWHRRAILAAERGQVDVEETCLREAVKASEDTALVEQYRMRLAALFLQQERWGEGADMLQTLLANTSIFEPAQLEWLAGYRLEEKQYAQAEEAAAALVLHEQTDWKQIGWYLSGRALEEAGKAGEAEAAYRKASTLDADTPEGVKAAFRLAEGLRARSAYDEAEEVYQAAAEQAVSPEMQEFRARSYYGLGRCAEAREDWPAARRLYLSVGLLYDDPELTPDSLERAASVMDRLGLSKEAEQARKELADRYPGHPKKEKVEAVEDEG